MPHPFRENPFREKKLEFEFGLSSGATRYEQWTSHINNRHGEGKKAVDFIYPDETTQRLFFTEIKDYSVITRSGRARQGLYSIILAKTVAKKVRDSIEGFQLAADSTDSDERLFQTLFQMYSYRVVFHWEFKLSIKQPRRIIQMRQMKEKLRELLHGVCTHVSVENIGDNPSKYWTVRRIGRNEQ